MRTRLVRPTFLLQLVVCAASVALLVLALLLVPAFGRAIAIVCTGAVIIDLVLLDAALLREGVDFVERFILRRAARTGKPLNPRWFIDERPSD